MMRRLLCLIFAAVLCLLSSCEPAPEQYDLTQTNIPVYKTAENNELTLEILYPTNRISHKNPTVLLIHGGGWVSGSRELFYEEFEPLCTKLRQNGVTIVGVNYRYALNGLKWSDCLEDCKDALAYLIENAEQYDIDTKNIGIIGYSAGAHLAMMTAIETQKDIKLCVSLSGPTVMTFSRSSSFYSDALDYYRSLAFGKTSSELILGSPNALLSRRCKSEFLMVSGLLDDVVMPIHAQSFCDEATTFRIKTKLMLVDGLSHSYQSFAELDKLSDEITAHLVEVLR